MNGHLTAEQVSRWFLGDQKPEAVNHLRTCATCRAEIGRFENTLVEFRGSVREWSEKHYDSASLLQAQGKRAPFHPQWLLAALALLLFVGLTLNQGWRRTAALESDAADSLLLRQVDQQISRTVPSSMAPLTQLVYWDGKQKSEGQSK